MIASSSCFLNLSPPPGQSSPHTNIAKNPSIWQNKKEISWRKQSVLSVACVIVGLQMDIINTGDIALAREIQIITIIETKNEKLGATKWSDKRSCRPWRLNSLETIVPENLPRPAARRRWEAVGLDGVSAPTVKTGLISNNRSSDCFSM